MADDYKVNFQRQILQSGTREKRNVDLYVRRMRRKKPHEMF